MPKKAKELSAVAIKRMNKKGFYAVGGVAGLHLKVNDAGAQSWILRVSVGGKRRDIGLGGFPDVSLAEAREKAKQFRNDIAQGIDPIHVKKQRRSSLLAARAAEITFEQSAKEFLSSKGIEWKNAKHAQQWTNTLETYVYPVIGRLQVKDVDLSHIVKILEPIWKTKTETAKRLRGRIENILDWASVRKYRSIENPARWKGYLDKVLPSPGKITKVEHHAALPVDEVGRFMQRLRKREGISSRALEFLVLTVARSGEVRGAEWPEFDMEAGVWTIPAHRMKAGKEHRVPLSSRAIALLKELPRFEDEKTVFLSPRGGILSDMALTAVTRVMEVKAVPHGFRSTFRDWVAEHTNYSNEVAEMALAHAIDNKVEAAYRRGDLFEKRRQMMNDWEQFCMIIQSNHTNVCSQI